MKKLISLFVLFCSLNSVASIAGQWTGFGTWKFQNKGEGARCMPMTMTWSENKNTLNLEQGYFDCEMVGLDLGSSIWTKKGDVLFDENNNEIGTYNGTQLNVIIPSPNEKTKISVSIKREANHIDYEEIWFNEFEKVYIITGRLFTSK